MRIAHVVASYHPAVGGLETHVKALADGCAAAGDQVTVLTHQASDDRAADEWAGAVRVLRFPLTVRAHHYPVSRDLFRYLREHAGDFDLIHAHNYHNLTGQAALSRAGPGGPSSSRPTTTAPATPGWPPFCISCTVRWALGCSAARTRWSVCLRPSATWSSRSSPPPRAK